MFCNYIYDKLIAEENISKYVLIVIVFSNIVLHCIYASELHTVYLLLLCITLLLHS